MVAHEVSILMSAVCAAMRPPYHGQRRESVGDSSIVSASVGLL
jgi:hypothetical protein